jgi:endonuclease YncB( thermonuclease family)
MSHIQLVHRLLLVVSAIVVHFLWTSVPTVAAAHFCQVDSGRLYEKGGPKRLNKDIDGQRRCHHSLVDTAPIADSSDEVATALPATSIHLVGTGNYYVVRAIDVGTIEVQGEDGQRLVVGYIGVDAPPLASPNGNLECFAVEGLARNREMVQGMSVRLERDLIDRDESGRLLRYVWVGDVLVNAKLVEEGNARFLTTPLNVRFDDLLLYWQDEARAARRGLWEKCASEIGDAPSAPLLSASGSGTQNTAEFITTGPVEICWERFGRDPPDELPLYAAFLILHEDGSSAGPVGTRTPLSGRNGCQRARLSAGTYYIRVLAAPATQEWRVTVRRL